MQTAARTRGLAAESWIIGLIGLADLITTIVFIQKHGAREANPIFQHYWDLGVPAFVAAKMVCLAGPLLILEWARKRRPVFTRFAMRGVIAGYLVMYSVGFMKLNQPVMARADEPSRTAYEAMLEFSRPSPQFAACVSRMRPGLRARYQYHAPGKWKLTEAIHGLQGMGLSGGEAVAPLSRHQD